MRKYTIEFYEKSNGEKPIEEFLLSMDKKMRTKAIGLMEILQDYGSQLREPYSKHLDDGIYELRIKFGNNISRILYFFYYEGKIVIANGFIKKTQKTPVNEINKAKKYRSDYIERSCQNEKI